MAPGSPCRTSKDECSDRFPKGLGDALDGMAIFVPGWEPSVGILDRYYDWQAILGSQDPYFRVSIQTENKVGQASGSLE